MKEVAIINRSTVDATPLRCHWHSLRPVATISYMISWTNLTFLLTHECPVFHSEIGGLSLSLPQVPSLLWWLRASSYGQQLQIFEYTDVNRPEPESNSRLRCQRELNVGLTWHAMPTHSSFNCVLKWCEWLKWPRLSQCSFRELETN